MNYFVINKKDLKEGIEVFHKKSEKGSVSIYEYGGPESIDVALAEMKGKYPIETDKTWARNTTTDMFYAVVSGKAIIYLEDKLDKGKVIHKGTVVYIPVNQWYRLETLSKTPFTVYLPSSPHWNPSQYQEK